MNVQLNDILANPALIKEAPEEVLQNWIQQYPYVPLFHLYALKKKGNYSETDLHQTAFYFNNREKLFYLLNSKQPESRYYTVTESPAPPPPEETVTTTLPTPEIASVESTPALTVNVSEAKELPEPEPTPVIHTTDTLPEPEIPQALPPVEIPVATTTPVVPAPTEDRPLTVAERILLEIEQLKAERAKQAAPSPEVEAVNIPASEEISVPEEHPVTEAAAEPESELTETIQINSTKEIDVIQETPLAEQPERVEPETTQPAAAKQVPLSIQEEVIARIRKIQEEREQQLREFADSRAQTPETTTPPAAMEVVEPITVVPAATEAPVVPVPPNASEASTATEQPEATPTLSIQEEVIARIQRIKEERERQLQEFAHSPAPSEATTETPEAEEAIASITTEPVIVTPEVKASTATEQPEAAPALSIQEEVIASIQHIKEERERQLQEFAHSPTPFEVATETPEAEEVTTNAPTEPVAATPEVEVNTDTELQEVVPQETAAPALSIQEEVIARIRQIQQERAQQQTAIESAAPEMQVMPVVETTEPEEAIEPEVADVTAQVAVTETDIQIVDKTERAIALPEEEEKNPLETILTIVPETTPEKDIELIEAKLQPELEAEAADQDVLATIHAPQPDLHATAEISEAASLLEILPTEEPAGATVTEPQVTVPDAAPYVAPVAPAIEIAAINVVDQDPFAELFPEPLLVHIQAAEISGAPQEKAEAVVASPENTMPEAVSAQKPEAAIEEPIADTTVTVAEITHEEVAIAASPLTEVQAEENLPEEYPTEVVEHASILSAASDLYIPSVKEDSIEVAVPTDIISDKATPVPEPHELSIEDPIPANDLNDEVKKEPHTFVEWLKLLDGNLQIQTAEAPKETDNWIEIPRYEVEQTLVHKKAIQQEEQKLFEPNFEEGEVDLFNEIDEEVTKVATDSVQFKQDMMTETLARIYHKQGKTDKALEIYNTLRLKFPEKSAYFAALIEKIEKEK